MRISELFREIDKDPEVQKISPEKREELAEKTIQRLADKFTEILKEPDNFSDLLKEGEDD